MTSQQRVWKVVVWRNRDVVPWGPNSQIEFQNDPILPFFCSSAIPRNDLSEISVEKWGSSLARSRVLIKLGLNQSEKN